MKTRKKRGKTGKKWARYGLKRVNKERTGGINCIPRRRLLRVASRPLRLCVRKVFNDKHLSYNWPDAKWMYDKSRELGFPLTGGSSIPVYYREPSIEVEVDTPIQNSIVLGGAGDEGGIFHAIDVLQG